jgi:hypothetical protein
MMRIPATAGATCKRPRNDQSKPIELHPWLNGRLARAALGSNLSVVEIATTSKHKLISQTQEPSGSGAKQKMLPGFSLNTLMNNHAWPVGLCWVSTGGLIFFDGTITLVPLAI